MSETVHGLNGPVRRFGWAKTFELLCLAAVLAALAHVVSFFLRWGYLPQPFIYSVDGTFSDWFDPAFWAHNAGAYDNWRTVYPPLSFVFLNLFTSPSCYASPGANDARGCDWYGVSAIVAFYLLSVLVSFLALRKHDKSTALIRTMAISTGYPLLYTLERGNLILPCFVFFVLGYSPLLKKAWQRWLCVAITINFKPYLIFSALPYAAKRKWRWLEGCGFATVFVYLVTYALLGSGNPLELFENQRAWSNYVHPQYFWGIYSSTSFAPFIDAAKEGPYPLLWWVDSKVLESLLWLLPALIRVGIAGVALCMLAAWWRPGCAPMHRLSLLGLLALTTVSTPGGYAQTFVVFLVFMERWKGPGRITAILMAYVISISYDKVLIGVASYPQQSWLGGREVDTEFGIGLSQFIRPAAMLVMEYALIAVTLSAALRQRLPKTGTPGMSEAIAPISSSSS